jgi:hypothetical protein
MLTVQQRNIATLGNEVTVGTHCCNDGNRRCLSENVKLTYSLDVTVCSFADVDTKVVYAKETVINTTYVPLV